jgi:Predicted peptidyl-prolyl cis-trans isomerase (rotamase), cyclophilin family
MLVKVNGEKIELPEGSTIQDAIDAVGAPYLPGCVLGLVKGTEEVEKHVNKYSLKTNKGSIIIEILDGAPETLVSTWKERYKEFSKNGGALDHISGSGNWADSHGINSQQGNLPITIVGMSFLASPDLLPMPHTLYFPQENMKQFMVLLKKTEEFLPGLLGGKEPF